MKRSRTRQTAPPRSRRDWAAIQIDVCLLLLATVAWIFSTRLDVVFTLPKLFVLQALTPIVAVIWIIRARRDMPAVPWPVLATSVALALWSVVAAFAAVHVPTALAGVHGRYNGLWTQLLLVFVFLMIASSRFELQRVERFARGFVVLLCPVALYALVQFAGWDPLRWNAAVPRSASTIGNPVILAAVLGLALPFALVLTLRASSARSRATWAAALTTLLAASATTLSRGPIVASGIVLLLVLSVWIWERRQRWATLSLVAAGLVALVAMAGGYQLLAEVRDRVGGATAISGSVRQNTYVAALQIVREQPLTGVGPENFAIVYPRLRSEASEQVSPDVVPTMVHSGYLQVAATAGIPGLVAYLAVLLVVAVPLIRLAATDLDPRRRWLAIAFVASIAGYAIQDVVGWLEVPLSACFWIVMGVGVSLYRHPDQPGAPRPWVRRVLVTTAAVGAVAAGMLAWTSMMWLRTDAQVHAIRAMNPREAWPRLAPALATVIASPSVDATYLDVAALSYAEQFAAAGALPAYRQSADLFARATALNPFDPYLPLHRLALETVALQKKAIAESPLEPLVQALLASDPNNGSVHEGVARFRLAQGRVADAAVSVLRARTLRPGAGRYDELHGDIERLQGRRAAAADAYRSAVKKLPVAGAIPASHKVIVTLLEDKQVAAALVAARDLVSRHPGDALGHTLLGYAHLAGRDAPAARAAFEAALRINPSDPDARQGLGEIAKIPK